MIDNTKHSPNFRYAGLTLLCLLLITLAASVRCSPSLADEAVTVRCRLLSGAAASSFCADIFVFEDNELAALDTYQRISVSSGKADAVMTGGSKIICTVINPVYDRYYWAGITGYSSLAKQRTYLKDETPQSPLQTGEIRIKAGTEACEICATPLMACIRISGIKCDFSGKAYEGAVLNDACAYLTNVNSSYPIMDSGAASVTEIINAAGLNAEDLASLKSPEMLYARLPASIGDKHTNTDVLLYCYPNTCEEETLGSRFTRLVIDGYIDGKHYLWPLNINRGDLAAVQGTAGIERNRLYDFDICITALGTDDPDKALSKAEISLRYTVREWNDKDSYNEYF